MHNNFSYVRSLKCLSSTADIFSSTAFSTQNSHQLISEVDKIKETVSALLFQCKHMLSNPGVARIILHICTLTLCTTNTCTWVKIYAWQAWDDLHSRWPAVQLFHTPYRYIVKGSIQSTGKLYFLGWTRAQDWPLLLIKYVSYIHAVFRAVLLHLIRCCIQNNVGQIIKRLDD